MAGTTIQARDLGGFQPRDAGRRVERLEVVRRGTEARRVAGRLDREDRDREERRSRATVRT